MPVLPDEAEDNVDYAFVAAEDFKGAGAVIPTSFVNAANSAENTLDIPDEGIIGAKVDVPVPSPIVGAEVEGPGGPPWKRKAPATAGGCADVSPKATAKPEDAEAKAEAEARALLGALRAREAAARLDSAMPTWAVPSLREQLQLQLRILEGALETLSCHPKLEAAASTVSSPHSAASSKRDVVSIDFDLDEHGRRVEAVVEFYPDDTVSLNWKAVNLPAPLPYVICLVQEIDLLGDVAPFIETSGVIHQFSSNEADRIVRVVNKPPIPFVAGLEALAQRFGFDLLDTPWQGLCLVETCPDWQPEPGAAPDAAPTYRGVPKPAPFRPRMQQVEVKTVVALGCPVGPRGELTTIFFSGKGDLKVPRKLLPDWVLTWLIPLIGRIIYSRACERIAAFDSSRHGERLRGSVFYAELHRRIAEFIAARHGAEHPASTEAAAA
eukprot:gnl/TRDRNA2_/TRDRNA2_162259_c2_seq2.p1 gnl/TRDRNA2_/TRDRNA2_162259_c2~~gnl/TRDRNA2_/TRDRNA2_162259_c2_seq2.p1  ORF type:complete len:485 (-),score=94.05 gnl/TRDRNA2_/TRDRNA2_162259_c2_seq2:95-1408(-)